ncbi:transglutaminase family protein [Pelagicoccus sp. SDUM812003]|uniref:transglutaminase family protein n=1 Tax=Pelagicoccus sp. SDUM812003 TaxID=3041267 RepID=UPI00280FE2CA|nr:transglutaminase family protein [Pelagicoccus sp. SDUM812003]MDQ8204755.1 transglutaminase family protein [Pelagicoccus sp. SDUM812003]
MARYDIKHKTTYRYAFPVNVSHHSARLQPLSDDRQSCESFQLNISPSSVDLIERIDYFGNTMQMFSVQELHESLEVESRSKVIVTAEALDLSSLDLSCAFCSEAINNFRFPDNIDAKQFVYATDTTQPTDEVEAFARRFVQPEAPIGKALSDMLDAFATEFTFDPTATEVSTPITQVLEQRKGVCQDFAHLMISALRSQGLAARYVSGYILTEPPEGQERLEGADASHAWLSVYVPKEGWIDVDPTNRLVCGDQHIRVSVGRDYFDVSMLKGAVTGGGEQKLSVEVTVRPVD